jgi:hypothetical protein
MHNDRTNIACAMHIQKTHPTTKRTYGGVGRAMYKGDAKEEVEGTYIYLYKRSNLFSIKYNRTYRSGGLLKERVGHMD